MNKQINSINFAVLLVFGICFSSSLSAPAVELEIPEETTEPKPEEAQKPQSSAPLQEGAPVGGNEVPVVTEPRPEEARKPQSSAIPQGASIEVPVLVAPVPPVHPEIFYPPMPMYSHGGRFPINIVLSPPYPQPVVAYPQTVVAQPAVVYPQNVIYPQQGPIYAPQGAVSYPQQGVIYPPQQGAVSYPQQAVVYPQQQGVVAYPQQIYPQQPQQAYPQQQQTIISGSYPAPAYPPNKIRSRH